MTFRVVLPGSWPLPFIPGSLPIKEAERSDEEWRSVAWERKRYDSDLLNSLQNPQQCTVFRGKKQKAFAYIMFGEKAAAEVGQSSL